jgi:hypothetical protein
MHIYDLPNFARLVPNGSGDITMQTAHVFGMVPLSFYCPQKEIPLQSAYIFKVLL